MEGREDSRPRACSNDSRPRSSASDRSVLPLSRVRSQDFSIAESVAVPGEPSDGSACCDDNIVQSTEPPAHWPQRVKFLLLLCAFLTSLSFGVTQVPLLYVFRLMTCDAYYEEHLNASASSTTYYGSMPSYTFLAKSLDAHGTKDRCSRNAIESATALSISLLGATTTCFGIVNLFITNRLVKSIGVKPALFIQVFFPAIRLLIQNVGVSVWGKNGIIIIQCSQIASVVGGPSGYLLALNSFVADVCSHEERTAALGRLTGSQMFGSALGFLLGGLVADRFGNEAPFRLTLALFLAASGFVAIALPHIAPANAAASEACGNGPRKQSRWAVFAGPLTIFAPRRFVGADGSITTEYGSLILACGVFLGILATGYLPTLLQLYATDVFGFGTKQNGWLIFCFSMLRGIFLMFAFPFMIRLGRTSFSIRHKHVNTTANNEPNGSSETEALLSSESSGAMSIDRQQEAFRFDLMYTRSSLLIDGLLTLLCSFVREGRQMYLVAAVLPFGSGTGSAAKGTVLHMIGSNVGSSGRADALAGVSLVENMARLSTTFAFGVIFAGFASIGRTELVFVCNAVVALVGFGVLLFAHFPPIDSRPVDENEGD